LKGYLQDSASGVRTEIGQVAMIGRSPECTVIVPDPRVSRRHAMIRWQDHGYWYFDLGSFNGTYLNGTRVTAARKLSHGDVLDLAGHQLRFEQDGGGDGSAEALGGATMAFVRSTPVIVLVSDIQGFTALSEKLTPDDLAQVIGGWYANCETILARHGATVDKFIGDCVLAYWTQIIPEARHAALRAAGELIGACHSIQAAREELFASIGHTFQSGVALNIGKVAYGGMSQGEFTLVGDPVNLTFRVESLTRHSGYPALVTSDFLKDWPEGYAFCENAGTHQVKGREQSVEIWGVRSFPA